MVDCKYFNSGVCLITLGGCYPEGCPCYAPDLSYASKFPKVRLPVASSWCTAANELASAHLKIELADGKWCARWTVEIPTTDGLGVMTIASSPTFESENIESVLSKAYKWAQQTQQK